MGRTSFTTFELRVGLHLWRGQHGQDFLYNFEAIASLHLWRGQHGSSTIQCVCLLLGTL